MMRFSLIIPVYNRPDEAGELLESLVGQEGDFEVILVDDGSDRTCRDVALRYIRERPLKYFFIPNGGPGPARNYGATQADGEYLIFLDSDCIVPPGYIEAVERGIAATGADAFGGPDRAHPSFSDTQKAINYSMTSFFTTGGIRGGRKRVGRFYPRSFNMGIRADVFRRLGGFSEMRFGEDIDLSLRIVEGGYSTALFPDAWVWHKRRTDFRKFFRQVMNSGVARINLWFRHPQSLRLVHLLPSAFTVGVAVLLLLSLAGLLLFLFGAGSISHDGLALCLWSLAPIVLYTLLIYIDSAVRNRSLRIGVLSVVASFIQLTGYGLGFLLAWWRRCVLRQPEFGLFRKNFYE